MMNNNQQQYYYNQQTPSYGGSSFAFAHAPPSVNPSYHAPPPPPPPTPVYQNPYHYPTQQQQQHAPVARPNVPLPAAGPPAASFAQGDLIDFSASPPAVPGGPQPNNTSNIPQQIVVVHGGSSTAAASLSTPQQQHPSWTPDLVNSQTEIQAQIHEDVVDEQLKIMADICRRNIQEQDDRELALRMSSHSTGNSRSSSSGLVEYNHPPNSSSGHHNHKNGRVVPHTTGTIDNPTPIAPKRQKLKQVRPYKTAVGAAGGAVVGGLVLAPVAPLGVVLGAAAGGAATNKICKSKEKRVQRKYEQHNFQLQAELNSPLAKQNGHVDLV